MDTVAAERAATTVPPDTESMARLKVSVDSAVVLEIIGTVILADNKPAAMVTVPVVVV